MSPKQKKIAAKAPPPNVFNEKDLAVLREEKAKGRGMGLQDEKVKPGKVKPVKAVLGIAAMGLMGAKYLKDKNKKATPMIGAAAELMKKKKELLGKKMGGGMIKARVGKSIKTGKISDMSFDEKMKRVESGQINKKTGKFTSMNAMRDAKGFQKGESAANFNKRRMKIMEAAKIAKSTRLGKILLPVVGAAVAAKTYLNSKMKKNKDGTPKKKMGGGMMQKPMGYKSGMGPAGAAGPSAGRPGGRRPMQQGPKGGIGSLPKKRNSDDLVVIFSTKDGTKQIKRSDLDNMSAPKKKMGGGMMQKPMGYTKGTMVKARGCKLGRTRPTKIT